MDLLDDFSTPLEAECGFQVVTSSKKLKRILNGEQKPALSNSRSRQFSSSNASNRPQRTRSASSPVRELSEIDFISVKAEANDANLSKATKHGDYIKTCASLPLNKFSQDVFSASTLRSKHEQKSSLGDTGTGTHLHNTTDSALKQSVPRFAQQKNEQSVLRNGFIQEKNNMESPNSSFDTEINSNDNIPSNPTVLEEERYIKGDEDLTSLNSLAVKLSNASITPKKLQHSTKNILTTVNRSLPSKPSEYFDRSSWDHSHSSRAVNYGNNVRPTYHNSYNNMHQHYPRSEMYNGYNYRPMSTSQTQYSGNGGWGSNQYYNNSNNYQYGRSNYSVRPPAQNNFGNYRKPFIRPGKFVPFRNYSYGSSYQKYRPNGNFNQFSKYSPHSPKWSNTKDSECTVDHPFSQCKLYCNHNNTCNRTDAASSESNDTSEYNGTFENSENFAVPSRRANFNTRYIIPSVKIPPKFSEKYPLSNEVTSSRFTKSGEVKSVDNKCSRDAIISNKSSNITGTSAKSNSSNDSDITDSSNLERETLVSDEADSSSNDSNNIPKLKENTHDNATANRTDDLEHKADMKRKNTEMQEKDGKVYNTSKLISKCNGTGINYHSDDEIISSTTPEIDCLIPKPMRPISSTVSSQSSTYRTSKVDYVEGSFFVVQRGHFISRDKCFLFGVSLYEFNLKDLIQIGQPVEYELENASEAVRECWIGFPPGNEKKTYELLQEFCRNNNVSTPITCHLLQQTNYIPENCTPITSFPDASDVVCL